MPVLSLLWPRVAARRLCRPALLLLLVPLSGAGRATPRPPAPAVGRIAGEVLISAALSPRRPRFRIYADPGPGARPPVADANEVQNVVLYLNDAPPPAGQVPARAVMAQEHERFVPHVLPVMRGSTVDFPNADPIFHNVFSLSSARSFDLGRYPQGSTKAVRFDESGVVQVFCHIHSDMTAIVLVLDNPYFARPTPSGSYALDDVPPGEYTLVAWHERIRPVRRSVRVVAGETTRLDLTIPLPQGDQRRGP